MSYRPEVQWAGVWVRGSQRPTAVDRYHTHLLCTWSVKKLFFAVACPARQLRSGDGSLLKFPRTPVGKWDSPWRCVCLVS